MAKLVMVKAPGQAVYLTDWVWRRPLEPNEVTFYRYLGVLGPVTLPAERLARIKDVHTT